MYKEEILAEMMEADQEKEIGRKVKLAKKYAGIRGPKLRSGGQRWAIDKDEWRKGMVRRGDEGGCEAHEIEHHNKGVATTNS